MLNCKVMIIDDDKDFLDTLEETFGCDYRNRGGN